MVCSFHIDLKPRSANKPPRQGYSLKIATAARDQYDGPLLTDPLYSRIIWFHKYVSTQGDADNIAKRIHDALKGVLFADDRLITHSLAVRVDATRQIEIVADALHPTAAASLVERLSDPSVRDILYIELGRQTDQKIHLGSIA